MFKFGMLHFIIILMIVILIFTSVDCCCYCANRSSRVLPPLVMCNHECVFQVVLNCKVNEDIQYTKANPKFHHWSTGEKRYGLTFERCDDAKAFDHGVRHAVAELNEGKTEKDRNK